MKVPKISVIIPIYKAEPYIEKCLRSLFSQTLLEIEYIFIDDCSPDKSLDILNNVLAEYPTRKDWVKIFRMPVNSGQAAARNKGLEMVSGEYTIHCDPDDWVDVDYYETLYYTAIDNKREIIIGDYKEVFGETETNHNINLDYNTPKDLLYSQEYVLYTLWLFCIKTSLIKQHNLRFFEDINCSEDWGFIVRAVYFADSIIHSNTSFYHYRKDNPEAITKSLNSEVLMNQRIQCLRLLDDFFYSQGESPHAFANLMRAKRDLKDTFLQQKDYKNWKRIFPEVAIYEFHHSHATFPYKLTYLAAHFIGEWVIKSYIKITQYLK